MKNTTNSILFNYVNDVLHERCRVVFKPRGFKLTRPTSTGLDASVHFGMLLANSYNSLETLDLTYRNNFIGKYCQENQVTFLEYLDAYEEHLYYDFISAHTEANLEKLIEAVWKNNRSSFCYAYEECVQQIFNNAYAEHVSMLNEIRRKPVFFGEHAIADARMRLRDIKSVVTVA